MELLCSRKIGSADATELQLKAAVLGVLVSVLCTQVLPMSFMWCYLCSCCQNVDCPDITVLWA